MTRTQSFSFDDPIPSKRMLRKVALKIMERYMSAIYSMTTVNHDHIFASMLKLIPFKNVDEPIKVYRVLFEEEVDDQFSFNEKIKKPKSKILYYILAGLTIVMIAILLFWKLYPIEKIIELEKSIAVLPLEYLSANPDNEYLANGVLDAITGHLSLIKGLRVMPRTSVKQYRENK